MALHGTSSLQGSQGYSGDWLRAEAGTEFEMLINASHVVKIWREPSGDFGLLLSGYSEETPLLVRDLEWVSSSHPSLPRFFEPDKEAVQPRFRSEVGESFKGKA